MNLTDLTNRLEKAIDKLKDEQLNDRLKTILCHLHSITNEAENTESKPNRKIVILSKEECNKNKILSKLFGFEAKIFSNENFIEISKTKKSFYELQVNEQEIEYFDSIDNLNQKISAISPDFQSNIKIKFPKISNNELIIHNLIIDTPFYNINDKLDSEIVDKCQFANVILLMIPANGSVGFKDKSILEKIIDKDIFEKIIFIFTDIEKIPDKDIQRKFDQHKKNANDIANKTLNIPHENIIVMFIDSDTGEVNELNTVLANNNEKDEKHRTFQSKIQEIKQLIESELNQFNADLENKKNFQQENEKNLWIKNCEELIKSITVLWDKVNIKETKDIIKNYELYVKDIINCLINFDPNLKLLEINNFQEFDQSTIDFILKLEKEVLMANRNKRVIQISNEEINAFMENIIEYNSQFKTAFQISVDEFSERIYKIILSKNKNISTSEESDFLKETFSKLFDLISEIMASLKDHLPISKKCLTIENIYYNLNDKIKNYKSFENHLSFLFLIELLLLFISVRKYSKTSWLFGSEISWEINSDIINLLKKIFTSGSGFLALKSIKNIKKKEIEELTYIINGQCQMNGLIDETDQQKEYLNIRNLLQKLLLD